MECKWMHDEHCVNDQCPARGDYCPAMNYPEICRHAERPEPPKPQKPQKFTPVEGEKYRCKYGGEFICVIGGDDDHPYEGMLRNLSTNWQILAHGCVMYPDGTIEWDYSTHGRFMRPKAEDEEE